MKQITIYTTNSCRYCKQAKDYFKSKEIPFKEVDMFTNKAEAQKVIEESGSMSVPIIKIDKKYIIGFNKELIDDAL